MDVVGHDDVGVDGLVFKGFGGVGKGFMDQVGDFGFAEVEWANFGGVEETVHKSEGFFRWGVWSGDVALGREAAVETPSEEDGLV
jgi:hypothetical protein